VKEITLKTLVNGQFEATALVRAFHEQAPFEPNTDYTIAIAPKHTAVLEAVPANTAEPEEVHVPRRSRRVVDEG